jgi:hypothetical protein
MRKAIATVTERDFPIALRITLVLVSDAIHKKGCHV